MAPLPRPQRRGDNALRAVRLSPPSSAGGPARTASLGLCGRAAQESDAFNAFHGRMSSCSDVLVFHLLNIREFPGSVWSFRAREILVLLTLQFFQPFFSHCVERVQRQSEWSTRLNFQVVFQRNEISFKITLTAVKLQFYFAFKLRQSRRAPTRCNKTEAQQK